MAYTGERQRSQKQATDKPKIGFIQGLKLWANQWRWSSIKQTWNHEYSRVHYNSNARLQYIGDKIGKR